MDKNGLYVKYHVTKIEDDSPVDGCFVLRPDKDDAAVTAMYAYAVATKNKKLAEDIKKWMAEIERGKA